MLSAIVLALTVAISASAADVQHGELHAKRLLGGADSCAGQNGLINLMLLTTVNCPTPPTPFPFGAAGSLTGGFGGGVGGGLQGVPFGNGPVGCGSQFGTINAQVGNQYNCIQPPSNIGFKEAKKSDKVAKRSDKVSLSNRQDAKIISTNILGIPLSLKDTEEGAKHNVAKRSDKASSSNKQAEKGGLLSLNILGMPINIKDTEQSAKHDSA